MKVNVDDNISKFSFNNNVYISFTFTFFHGTAIIFAFSKEINEIIEKYVTAQI